MTDSRASKPTTASNPAMPAAAAGWILYDDSCGFCRRWVPYWENTLAKRGFRIAPLQTEWVRALLSLSDAELVQDLRLLLPEGRQITGADVYRHCTRRIWWAWPIWLFGVLPGGCRLFDWGYRTFARNRYCVSDACRLPGAGPDAPVEELTASADQGLAAGTGSRDRRGPRER